MQIDESDFWMVELLTPQIFLFTWKETASTMEADVFKNHLRKFIELLKEYQIESFLVDSRKGHMMLSPEMQTWHDEEIVPAYLDIGIRKISFIEPEDLHVAVSVYMTFDEKKGRALNLGYFKDKETALNWIQEG